MSFVSKKRPLPLFVNNSQIQKYCCSSTASPSDKSADNQNIFSDFSTLKDTFMNQSAKTCVNDIESSCKPDCATYVSNLASPIFDRQKPSSGLCSMTVDYEGSKTPPLTDAVDSDVDSPVIAIGSRKRTLPLLIDSDSSDDQSNDCGGKVYKSSSYYSVSESRNYMVVAKSDGQRLSDLEHRHCFDLLLNCERSNTVTNSNVFQSLQKSSDEPQRGNHALKDSVKCISQSLSESLDKKMASQSYGAMGNSIHSISNQCSVCLHKLQLRDISHGIVLSQEDRLSLSGKCRSAVSSEASTVNNDSTLSASADLTPVSEVDVNNSSVLQSYDLHCDSNDDLFSDNEAVESVCISPSHYCYQDEQKHDILHDISKPLDKTLESAATSKQSEVTFVRYSQDVDDCILIDDSDDELFANLTQNDMTLKVEDDDDDERHQSDDCQGFVSADDDEWMRDDIDYVTAAASANSVMEAPVTSELHDPWINDVADISSDELEEAYDAAMSYAHQAKAYKSDSQKIYCDDHDALINANMRQQFTDSACKVSLKRLRLIDIPPQISLSQEDKCICEPDVVPVNYSSDDSDSDVLSESVESMSISCEVNIDTTCGDLRHGDNNSLATSADACEKTETALTSTNLTETTGMDCEKLACCDTFAVPVRQTGSDVLESAKGTVVDEWCQVSSGQGNFAKSNKAMSDHDTSNVTKNVALKGIYDKRSARPRMVLENCAEVAEFYGIKIPLENKRDQHESEVTKGTMNVEKYSDTNHKNTSASRLPHLKKNNSQLLMTEPHHLKPQKRDIVKLGDSSLCKQEDWKRKSTVQSSDVFISV